MHALAYPDCVNRKAVSAVTMVVLIGLLVAGAWYGWQSMSAPLPGRDDEAEETPTAPTCPGAVAKGDIVSADDITVSVYNAGSRSGLADQTLTEMAGRGFNRGEVGNAPSEFEGVRFVRVLAQAKRDPVARLVALQFGRDTLVQPVGDDLGPGVEVIVGDDFAGLVDARQRLRARRASPGC